MSCNTLFWVFFAATETMFFSFLYLSYSPDMLFLSAMVLIMGAWHLAEDVRFRKKLRSPAPKLRRELLNKLK